MIKMKKISIALLAFVLPITHASAKDMLQVKLYSVDSAGKTTILNSFKSAATYQREGGEMDAGSPFEKPGNVMSVRTKKSTPYLKSVFCEKANSEAGNVEKKPCDREYDQVSSGFEFVYQVRETESSNKFAVDVKASLVELLSMQRMALPDVKDEYIDMPETQAHTTKFSAIIKKDESYTYPLNTNSCEKQHKPLDVGLILGDRACQKIYIDIKLI
ncbi:hypothetical protein [Aeromonas veronii]|uniref:Uncharacterized protein n=1 Tax=Aeromonas veronii TaxID=654 RepID=A0A4S5CNA8_AERVE|nr:hypothetical protein [Aeromonas veronii]THJ44988.1 hypothetical protein E8Q35_12425 [Aeromonas veronii]